MKDQLNATSTPGEALVIGFVAGLASLPLVLRGAAPDLVRIAVMMTIESRGVRERIAVASGCAGFALGVSISVASLPAQLAARWAYRADGAPR